MIPGCAPPELLEVGHVVVNALKAVEGKANDMKYSACEFFFLRFGNVTCIIMITNKNSDT